MSTKQRLPIMRRQLNPTWQTVAILKIAMTSLLCRGLNNLDEIWCTETESDADDDR